ncbi:MAG: glycine zipper domain-containing protein [Solirubrobacterales bacterium]
MSRKIALASMALAVMLAGCQGQSAGEFAKEHKGGLIGGAAGAGLGGIVGRAVGHNTTSTVIGAGVGAGLGYILGNEYDKRQATRHDVAQPTALTGTNWRVDQLNVPNAPAYKEMYLSFEPNSRLVTTTVEPDGRVVKAEETYRIADHTLIINNPGSGNQAGYIINAGYAMTGDKMSINSPDFSAQLERANQVPSQTTTASAQ